MTMGGIVLARALSTATSDQLHVLGSLYINYATGKAYRYVKAGSDLTNDTLAAGNFVSYLVNTTLGTPAYLVTNKSANVTSGAGVAVGAIPESYYGWIQIGGVASIIADDGAAFGEALVPHGDGTLDTMADGEEEQTVAVALEDSAATTYATTVMLKNLM